MKKFVAILLAVLTVLSATSMMVFAADPAPATTDKPYACDFCDKDFASVADLKAHLDATFPVRGHEKACPNADKGCDYVFTTKVAYDAHVAICSFNDTRTDAEKIKDAFKAGDYSTALKLIAKIVIDFVKSDSFKKLLDKVGSFIKGINLDKAIASVKDVVAKIPFDKIGDLFNK